jgi:hypothetical protein
MAVIARGKNWEYGDPQPIGGSSATYNGLRSGDLVRTVATLSTVDGWTNGSGAAISNPSGLSYRIVYAPGRGGETPRLITVTPNAGQSREYGDANPVLGYTLSRTTAGATGAALVNGNTLSGALASAATGTSNVGDHAITQGDLAGGGNYTISFTSDRTMAVTPRLITVTPNSGQSREYGDANPTLTYALSRTTSGATGAALVNSGDLNGALASSATVLSPVGNYAINQGDLALNANYNMTFTTGRTMEVTPRLITVTAADQRILAGLAVPDLTYSIGGRGLANQDQITGVLVTEGSSSSVPGQYQILPGSLLAGENYLLTYVPGVLTIDPNATNVTDLWASTVSGIVMDRSNSLSNAPLPFAGLPPSSPAQPLRTQIANISAPLADLVFDNVLITQSGQSQSPTFGERQRQSQSPNFGE